MIKLKTFNGSGDFWEVDGMVFRTPRRSNYSINDVESHVKELTNVVENDLYRQENGLICSAAGRFEGADFILIAYTVCKEHFLRMFGYYCIQYIESLKTLTTTDHNKVVPLYQVIQLMLNSETNFVSCWPINVVIKKLRCRETLTRIANGSYERIWFQKVESSVLQHNDLIDISRQITAQKTIEFLGRLDKELLSNYLTKRAEIFTMEREKISFKDLLRSIIYFQTPRSLKEYDSQFIAILKEIVEEQRTIQNKIFPRDNHLQMRMDSDKWVMYNIYGPALRKATIDFTDINCGGMALELKFFLKWSLEGKGYVNPSFFHSCVIVLNAITEVNSNVRYFADITDADARALVLFLENNRAEKTGVLLSQYNIAKAIRCCKSIVDYLMGSMRDEELKSPKPCCNPFGSYSFHNLREYNEVTQAIPEEVIERLDEHISELSTLNRLLYNIFKNTGLRLKEVFSLEHDCIESSKYDNLCQLKFKPYKVLAARKRVNAGDYHRVLIQKALADEIALQIVASAELREEYGLPYIFLSKTKNRAVTIIDSMTFIRAVRALINKYDIRDENGEKWHFTSRQFRKTVAVTLIENGTTTEELAYWLGHLCSDTAAKYYAEVRKAKLAELNTRFFKEKFDLILSGEQLETYSEEERRLLYTDFRLEQRRVELGYCLRKLADGWCGKRNSMYNCVNCKNLCTGEKYLPYWRELLTGQESIVSELLRIYKNNGISGFQDFAEYRQESILLEGYKNIIKAIAEGGGRL